MCGSYMCSLSMFVNNTRQMHSCCERYIINLTEILLHSMKCLIVIRVGSQLSAELTQSAVKLKGIRSGTIRSLSLNY